MGRARICQDGLRNDIALDPSWMDIGARHDVNELLEDLGSDTNGEELLVVEFGKGVVELATDLLELHVGQRADVSQVIRRKHGPRRLVGGNEVLHLRGGLVVRRQVHGKSLVLAAVEEGHLELVQRHYVCL